MAQTVTFSIRLPADVAAELRAMAQQSERTINRQVLYILRLGLEVERHRQR